MIFDVVGFLGSYMARYAFLMTLVVSIRILHQPKSPLM